MTQDFGIRKSELGIPTRPPADLDFVGGWVANPKFEIRNSKSGFRGGWAAFRILNSEFRIGWVVGDDRPS